MNEEEYMNDIFWDIPVKAPNLAYNDRYSQDDEFDEEEADRPVAESPTASMKTQSSCVYDCVGEGRLSGYGTGDDIVAVISRVLAYDPSYHFEFKFWKIADPKEPVKK